MTPKAIELENLANLGRLAASVAHEIHNPLSGIIGYAQLLKANLRGRPDLQEDIEKIERENQRLRVLARSMLGLSRPPCFQEASLKDIAGLALGILAPEIKARGAEVT